MMLMVPDWLDSDAVGAAVLRAGAMGKAARLDDVRLETPFERMCVRTLHVRPFDDEGAILESLHYDFVSANRLRVAGEHHEVDFSDFRRASPTQLSTVLHQPVRV